MIHFGGSMLAPLIPWPVFFKALQMQKPTIVHAWLRYWIFSDDGAALLPRSKDGTAESSSPEEREKTATWLFTAKRKWPETFH
jgi:hypothetical protein